MTPGLLNLFNAWEVVRMPMALQGCCTMYSSVTIWGGCICATQGEGDKNNGSIPPPEAVLVLEATAVFWAEHLFL